MNKETMKMLLEYLNQMFPISIGFRNDLTTMMSETVTLGKVVTFLNVGDPVNSAWFLEEGFVKGTIIDWRGTEIVVRLYKPGDIIADLDGFFKHKRASIRFTSITPCSLSALKRNDYLKLEVYPETQKLKEFMLLLEKQIDFERAEMMSLKPRGRFLHFAARHGYALAHLPNRLCACFVNIHEADYGKYKAAYLRGK